MDSDKSTNYQNSLQSGELLIEATKSTGKNRLLNILQALINFLGKDATVDEGSAILKFIKSRLKK